jgi:hypothetical protein
MTLTEKLDELKRVCDAATPRFGVPCGSDLWLPLTAPAAHIDGWFYNEMPLVPSREEAEANALFVCESRTAMPQLVEACREYETQMQRLLNKVNAVTALWRHGERVGENAMVELCNRQIDVEQDLTRIHALLEVKG